MVRRILGVIVGLGVGFLLIMFMEESMGKFYPPPPGTDFKNPESVKTMIHNMPIGAFLMLLLGYAVASFSGGLVASLVAGVRKPIPAIIVGTLLTFSGIGNLVMMPGHPMWFAIVSSLVYIPLSYLGYLVVQSRLKTEV
jgi:hypothetical protein